MSIINAASAAIKAAILLTEKLDRVGGMLVDTSKESAAMASAWLNTTPYAHKNQLQLN